MNRSTPGRWLLLWLLALAAPAQGKEFSVVGAWTLVSYVRQESGGASSKPWGEKPVGYLMYLPDGHMSAVLTAEGRASAGANDTEGQARRARRARLYTTVTAYAGTYTVEGDKVVHHVEVSWNHDWVGSDQPRWASIEGDRLIIRTQPLTSLTDGKEHVYVAEWKRAPAVKQAR